MQLGNLVHDYALGRDGIIVGSDYIEIGDGSNFASGDPINWEWLVLYDGGELIGADTNDLKVIDESR